MIRPFDNKTPKIAGSTHVDPTAVIIGDVEIGEECSIWPGAVIRGDMGKITIGDQSIVEDNCVIHSGAPGNDPGEVVIGRRVIIGHGAALNCSRVGDFVLIGMNATLLHRARVGSYCLIGAASLVGDSQTVPDNSLVLGVPGKIKGAPTEKQRWWLEHAFEGYHQLAVKHGQSLASYPPL